MNQPIFYVGDEVTVVDRGSERFVITKTPAYTGGSYTLTGSFDDTLEIFVKFEGLTLYKPSSYRPAHVQLREKVETKRSVSVSGKMRCWMRNLRLQRCMIR